MTIRNHPEFHVLLFGTIKDFESREAMRLNDPQFDAFNFLAPYLDKKSASSLRKMCLPHDPDHPSQCKLGYLEAISLMDVTRDYRLEVWMIDEIFIRQAKHRNIHIDVMASPMPNPLLECPEDK